MFKYKILLESYKLRIQVEYILEYLLWAYILNEQDIAKLEAEKNEFHLEKDNVYRRLITNRHQKIYRMKKLRTYIYEGDKICFPLNSLVDRHQLYKVNMEEYREFRIQEDKKKGLVNNNDLDGLDPETPASKSGSPTGKLNRSAKSSPGKKAKRSGSKGKVKKGKTESEFLETVSKTYDRSDRQYNLF